MNLPNDLILFVVLVQAVYVLEKPFSMGMAPQTECRSLCASCQSMRPARINQICSVGLLTSCSCPENALNLTMASSTESDRAASGSQSQSDCPKLDDTAVGFCQHGQQTDASGCLLGLCRMPPGCASLRTLSPTRCRLLCPSGYQTDSNGCPVCRCRCSFNAKSDSSSLAASQEESRRCAAACAAAFGAAANFDLVQPDLSDCPVCVCRIVSDQAAVTAAPPPALPATTASPPCLLRCPNSCGPHGYADGETRDDRGCVRDCSCRCPSLGRQSCPGGESCLRWEIDRYGCQVCTVCSQSQQQQQMMRQSVATTPGCVTKATLVQPNAIDRLCPADCLRGQFSISEDSSSGCLTCSCNAASASGSSGSSNSNSRCSSPEPFCSNNCGPHGFVRDAQGCIQPSCSCSCPDLNACVSSCSPSGNFTVSKDAYGCHACHCQSRSCPIGNFRCSRSCGHHGYEIDSSTGCQTSCQCRCPKRSCGCFYGSRQDAYGCETCECVTATEYLQLLPF